MPTPDQTFSCSCCRRICWSRIGFVSHLRACTRAGQNWLDLNQSSTLKWMPTLYVFSLADGNKLYIAVLHGDDQVKGLLEDSFSNHKINKGFLTFWKSIDQILQHSNKHKKICSGKVRICSDEEPALKYQLLNLFAMANLPYQVNSVDKTKFLSFPPALTFVLKIHCPSEVAKFHVISPNATKYATWLDKKIL